MLSSLIGLCFVAIGLKDRPIAQFRDRLQAKELVDEGYRSQANTWA